MARHHKRRSIIHNTRPQPFEHDHSQADHAQQQAADYLIIHHNVRSGLLGPYPMGRDASGTAWQPDVSSHGGVHAQAGDWQIMGHLMLNAAYDWQEGPPAP